MPQDWKLAAAIEIAAMVGRDDYITGIRTIIDGFCPFQDDAVYVSQQIRTKQVRTNAIAGESGAARVGDRGIKRGVE